MSSCAAEVVEPLIAERVLLPQSDESEGEGKTNDSSPTPKKDKEVPIVEETKKAESSSPSILINGTNGKTNRSPKRVSFDKRVELKADESVLKFVCGDEIIDQENPFRQPDLSDDEVVTKYNIIGIPTVVHKPKPRIPVARSRNSLTRLSIEEVERFKSKYSNQEILNPGSHSSDLELKTKIEGKTVGKIITKPVSELDDKSPEIKSVDNADVATTDAIDLQNNNQVPITKITDDSNNRSLENNDNEVREQKVVKSELEVKSVISNGFSKTDVINDNKSEDVESIDSNMSDKTKKRNTGIRKIFPVSLFSKARASSENGKTDGNWAAKNTTKMKPTRRITLESPKDLSDIKVVRRFGSVDVPRQPSMNLEDQVERMQRELKLVSDDKSMNLYTGQVYAKEAKDSPRTKIPYSSSSSSSTLISDITDNSKTPVKLQPQQISRLKKPSTDLEIRRNNNLANSNSGRNSAPIFSGNSRSGIQLSRLPKLHTSISEKPIESPLMFQDKKIGPKVPVKPKAVPLPIVENIPENTTNDREANRSKPVPAVRSFDKRAASFNVHHKTGFLANPPNRNVTDDSKAFEGVSAEMKITKAPIVYNSSKLRTRSLSPRQRHKLDGSRAVSDNNSGLQMLPDKEFGDDVRPVEKDVEEYAVLKVSPQLRNNLSGNIKSPQASSTPEKREIQRPPQEIIRRKVLSPIPAPILPPREVQKVQTRQNVEAFCWKKLQEMNRRNEEEIYANCFDRMYQNVRPNGTAGRSLTPPVVPPHAVNPAYADNVEMRQRTLPQASSIRHRQILPAPIFKRGSLVSEADAVPLPNGAKRVSFSGGSISPRLPIGPPVRRIVTVNDKVCDAYGRIHDVPKATKNDEYIRNPALRRPLPPVPVRPPCDSESGSEAGEVQRIMLHAGYDQNHQNEVEGSRGGRGSRQSSRSREDPRRHTLGGDMLYQQQLLPQRALDLEAPPTRGYAPLGLGAAGPLFDDDPGIMSEVETASTGFRRGGKQRSSLPVVRTPSKTLERPLGLVFLQYRNETKRALLPNEITSIDTVRALFVRSFPRQLTMAYLEGPHVKIYIHDSSKDMFYELEDLRSHLRDIRDRSVLRLFESAEVSGACPVSAGGIPVTAGGPPVAWGDADQSYFSEPEFDSEYRHQHVHKSKAGKGGGAPYYVGGSSTLPRLGGYDRKSLPPSGAPPKPMRTYGPSRGYPEISRPDPRISDQLYSIPDGYMSSPERGAPRGGGYEEPYYSQYGTRTGTVTPVIDEEVSETSLLDEGYSLYGVKLPPGGPRSSSRPPSAQPYDPPRHSDELHRMRVEHMERQLANLTGLVQKALTQTPGSGPQAAPREFLQVPGGQGYRDKSVSFEKSVSFSDEPPGISPKQHSPQHSADSRPAKPAIKSSTLPRTSSQERDRLKPLPPPKPMGLAPQAGGAPMYRGDLTLAPEVYNQLRGLQKKAKDLRTEVRTLRRMSQAQALAVREDIRDAFIRIRATLLAGGGTAFRQPDQDKMRLTREEELYKQEVLRLESDLSELEGSVESLRGEVINRRTRVNMSAVEDMALVLSRASKTVAELKMRFPSLQQTLRVALAGEMEQVVREEKFLKEEPERLESALRRCKKLTGTLVTLKRLASVQEQRLPPPAGEVQGESPPPTTPTSASKTMPGSRLVSDSSVGALSIGLGVGGSSTERPENALDALLDELQTFARPQDAPDTPNNTCNNIPNNGSLRRMHSYDAQPVPQGKPPVPERNAELVAQLAGRRVPPPPPPRTSSRSPLASPTSPLPLPRSDLAKLSAAGPQSNSSSCESVNSQEGGGMKNRNQQLDQRHQELLRKQKALQEQYARLQKLQQSNSNAPLIAPGNDASMLKKTGSEGNLLLKMNLNIAPAFSGSLTQLAQAPSTNESITTNNVSETNKVYETDIL